ncbi:MAG: hypothetical protein ACR2MG_12845 [Pyrinomonadaceae bacterium]
MKTKTYSIFGAGAAGLYTAWRLLWGEPKSEAGKAKMLAKGDILELYDWGKYDFSKETPGTRAAGARVCTWHYKNDKSNSFLELGGMRYAPWNENFQSGHLLVTTVINKLDLDKFSIPFNISSNTLFYLRTKNMYLNDINSSNPAPYNVANYGAEASPGTGFSIIESLAVDPNAPPKTRKEWCEFYQTGKINVDLGESSVYKKGELLKDIGYWNLMFDQLGSEGFNYTADGNGYTSNIINWNAADAIQSNDEFAPGSEYKTLTTGYSSMFNALFKAITELAEQKGIKFEYHPNTRLHSILEINNVIHYTTATRKEPAKKSKSKTTQAAWLAMPRYSLELVAQATRYTEHKGVDVLNHPKVQLYLESAINQPSYKVGMFFDSPWWLTRAVYPPQLTNYEITGDVLTYLKANGFPQNYISEIEKNSTVFETPIASANDFIKAVETCIQERLTLKQEELLLSAAENNTIGPSVTDTPIRQVVYFGNNALDKTAKPVYGILASYDDEQFASFWEELEIGPDGERTVAVSENYQPLEGPRKAPDIMVKMLRQQLAALHFGANSDYSAVPEPLETSYMDWSLPPFNAGYHAYAAHYDIGDVQRKIRKPSQLLKEKDVDIFIVGETYSNDQAWVEGAYCTAESVLNDFFDMEPIVCNENYPFICPE